MNQILDLICAHQGQAKNYEVVRRIGKGTYGKVFEARSVRAGMSVAIKACFQPDMLDYELEHHLQNECRLMGLLAQDAWRHTNLMHAHAAYTVPVHDTVLIVMPYMLGGSLERFIGNPEFNRTPETKRANLMMFTRQLLEGLNHLHHMGWAHRDLSTTNVVLDQTFQNLKICDFGMSCSLMNPQRRISQTTGEPGYTCDGICTLPFRAIELLLGDNLYDPMKADVWSLAMIVTRMIIQGEHLFWGRYKYSADEPWQESELLTQLLIFRFLGTPTEASWPGVTRLPGWIQNGPQFRCITDERFKEFWGQWDVPAPILAVLARAIVLYPRRRATAAQLIMEMDSTETGFGLDGLMDLE